MTPLAHPPAAPRRMTAAACRAMRTALRGATMLATAGALSATVLAAGKVAVTLEGDIAPECSIAGGVMAAGVASLGVPMDIGDVSRAGSRDFRFTLNCNAPFTYRLEAEHGALTHADAPESRGAVAAVPYEVAVHIPTDGAAIDDRCPGETIRTGRVTCPFTTSGDSIALDARAQLTVTWRPSEGMPLAGAYVERLTVMVATSL